MLLTESNWETKVKYTHIPWIVELFVLNLPAVAVKNILVLYILYTFPQQPPFGSGTPRNGLKDLNGFIIWKAVNKCWL